MEPLEQELEALGCRLVYPRVTSHWSTRLTVPRVTERRRSDPPRRSGFDPSTIRWIGREMPHVIVVDGCSAGHEDQRDCARVSRGARDYANWFCAFNDVRGAADDRGGDWVEHSLVPAEELAELRKSYKYEQVARQLAAWVLPLPSARAGLAPRENAYAITAWTASAERAPLTVLGDVVVPSRHIELPSQDIAVDGPTVVLANPILYANDSLPSHLHGTHPYTFLDEPAAHVDSAVEFGFGAHGLESRLVGGATVDEFTAAVQGVVEQTVRGLDGAGAPRL